MSSIIRQRRAFTFYHQKFNKIKHVDNSKSSNTEQFNKSLTLPPLDLSTSSNFNVNSLKNGFSNFNEPKIYYRQKIIEGNKELKNIYQGNSKVVDTFRKIFPEIVASRGITNLREKDDEGALFSRWKENNNNVYIGLKNSHFSDDTKSPVVNDSHYDAVFVGGPSSMAACLIYKIRYPQHRVQHFYAGRGDSNFDGSAYYYHQRDAAPVYLNRVNRGPYCIYIDLYKRLISPTKLAYQAESDRHHVKISMNWSNIKIRYLFTIFLPNQWHMINDIWLKAKSKTKIAHVIQHATRSMAVADEISKHTDLPVEAMIIHGKHKANYVGFNGSKTDPKDYFNWLNQYAYIPFNEITTEGFGKQVKQVLDFPNDGLVSPMIIENILKQLKILNHDEDVSRSNAQLNRIFVERVSIKGMKDIRATEIEWTDLTTNTVHRMKMNRLFVSLGPSGNILIEEPRLTWFKHFIELFRGHSENRTEASHGGYQATIPSLVCHTINSIRNKFFRGKHCLKDSMWASGSSSVLFLAVDKQRTTEKQLDVFSRFIDGVNQHWTLIAQRDVILRTDDDFSSTKKTYRFFAIQMTGGGNFPSRFVRPDYLLNLLYTTEQMYGIDNIDHALYDVVQSRACGRSVSAQNTIAFQMLAPNCVTSYALGGIGMTTMLANGEKMVEMLKNNDKILQDNTDLSSWPKNLLDNIDYRFMANNNLKLQQKLGFTDKMTTPESFLVLSLSSLLIFYCFIF